MKKKHVTILVLSIIILTIIIFLICFFTIPRIKYSYDKELDCYCVSKVYGNSSFYEIADTINDKPVKKINSRTFMNKSDLKKVKLGNNIVEIERLAFLDCHNLLEINLDNVEIIGRNAFENCSSLNKINLNLCDILGGTFMGCSNLEIINLNNTISIGSYAFAYTNINFITIPASCNLVYNNSFYKCNNLNKIYISNIELLNDPYLNSLNNVDIIFQ